MIVFDIFKPKKQRNKKAQSLEKSVFPRLFLLLNYFLKKINGRNPLIKPRILICCPSNITNVEKNAIKEAAEKTAKEDEKAVEENTKLLTPAAVDTQAEPANQPLNNNENEDTGIISPENQGE